MTSVSMEVVLNNLGWEISTSPKIGVTNDVKRDSLKPYAVLGNEPRTSLEK